MLIITIEDVLTLLCILILVVLFGFCKLSDWQRKRNEEKTAEQAEEQAEERTDANKADIDKFCRLLEACGIEFEYTADGIKLEDCALQGDGYLFIKFYEDGRFQEFIHYPM